MGGAPLMRTLHPAGRLLLGFALCALTGSDANSQQHAPKEVDAKPSIGHGGIVNLELHDGTKLHVEMRRSTKERNGRVLVVGRLPLTSHVESWRAATSSGRKVAWTSSSSFFDVRGSRQGDFK